MDASYREACGVRLTRGAWCGVQSLQALEKISHEHPTACLRAGALMAVLSYLDFFSTGVQVSIGDGRSEESVWTSMLAGGRAFGGQVVG